LKNSEIRYENANALNTIIKSKIKINTFLLISLNFNLYYSLDKIFTFGIEI